MGLSAPPILRGGKTLVVDSVYGSDAGGVRGRLDRPYATPAAARAAAQSGDTVVVRPGTYADSYLAKLGVTYQLAPGARLPNANPFAPPPLGGALVSGGAYPLGLYRDVDRLAPATATGDVVAGWKDASGGGKHLSQSTSGKRLKLRGGVAVSEYTANQYLSDGASSVNVRSFSAFAVVRLNMLREGWTAGGGDQTVRLIFRQQNDYLNLWFMGGANRFETYSAGAGPSFAMQATCSPMLVGLTGSASALTCWVNSLSQSTAALGANTGTGLDWFGTGAAVFPMQGDALGFALYNAALTAGQVDSVWAWALGLGAVDATAAVRVLAADGDSITAAVGATLNNGWFHQITTDPANLTVKYNWGREGFWTTDLATYAFEVDGIYQAGKNNILVVWIGSNDVAATADSGAVIFGRLQAYGAARRAAGWKVVMLTCLPRTDVSGVRETARTDYNAAIRAGWTSCADALIDVADAALYPQLSDATSGTYYNGGVHPSDAGNTIIAASVQAAVDSLW